MRTFRVFALAVAGFLAAALPAQAVDLGGNCCADLEERLRELMRQETLRRLAAIPAPLMLRLGPVGVGGSFAEAVANSGEFAHQLLSCRSDGDAADVTRFLREGQCVWTRASVREDDNRNGPLLKHYRENETLYSAGGQIDLGERWFLGAAAGVSQSEFDARNYNETEPTRVHLGAVVKYNPGAWLFAASLTGGCGNLDNKVLLNPVSNVVLATAETDIRYLTGNLTGAYIADLGGAYLKPQINVAISRVERDGYTQTASVGPNLGVTSAEETVATISPALEFGTEIPLPSGSIRPFVRGGFTWRSKADSERHAGSAKVSIGF